ncbi:hypothetical protein EDB92DRAFT_1854793 [Lactarius akahatsu]|uniref:HNH nuclease domain-containing protein n=1 Tax=Lactarius akahatsu TaxID=416441 RepID=A0AAD4LHQ2_9AGAM|nr:hypothetical protein EDB92DRAFT_1854793 [Lactarius akahatsu]
MGDIILRDFDGNTLSSFWQYGLIDWELFYGCVRTVIFAESDWAIFEYDESVPGGRGALCPPNYELPCPGTYVLLRPDGTPISVGFSPVSSRLRHPTVSNTPSPLRTSAYRERIRARDPCCLISSLPVVRGDFSRFKAAHIFPRTHDVDWVNKGYPSRITDPAPIFKLGGPTKIDSIQNVILLRSDLRDAWDNYKFAVNPDRGHVVIPFVPGYDDIAGKVFKLDHITDYNLRPLDDLFRDNFLQGVLKNMKGAGEPTWEREDALGDGVMDLSRQDIWGGKLGKEHLEFEMAHRLHDLRVAQGSSC